GCDVLQRSRQAARGQRRAGHRHAGDRHLQAAGIGTAADPRVVMAKRVGVLALQGDFEAHSRALERAGAEAVAVRTAVQLADVDGLVIPGGESTTMLKLLRAENMLEPL